MANQSSSGGRGFSFNLNGLLVLVTLAGGIMFVSKKLTSDRPLAPAGKVSEGIGAQTLEARLWEDPFHPAADGDEPNELSDLAEEIRAHENSGEHVLLLPVMVSGGPYSEDQESRIRSRFAIVSALGRSGYVPEDAEHIGMFKMKWPTTRELELWKTNAHAALRVVPKYVPSKNITTNSIAVQVLAIDKTPTNNVTLHSVAVHHAPALETNLTNAIGSVDIHVRYEWYRPRVFHPRLATATIQPSVLVLWLDDGFFQEEPLLRLPLFFDPLIKAAIRPSNVLVRLIGPRRSATLRAMLPDEFVKAGHMSFSEKYPQLWQQSTQTLGRIALYSATPNAMDEVLVASNSPAPRISVREKLRKTGFKDAHFFNATDAQMAGEILQELNLRGANLTNTAHHLVLLAEWDTFYGRMLSLTYGATLALWQSNSLGNPPFITRADFVARYRDGTLSLPSNFHNYVYLRGLDGRTVGEQGEVAREGVGSGSEKPGSFEDLLRWKPDANKAEGPGQFDYLSRTGEWLETLQKQLRLGGNGEIKAVGIVGSDVYDVLLILQALRHRFPDVLFFTTDLDARFLQPSESGWARNLIVASSYGLRLHPKLQHDIAPFRDSSQTAQFVAALAALDHPDLVNFSYSGVRRFEIGNRTAVDLSVTDRNSPNPSKAHPRIHPLTRSEVGPAHRLRRVGLGIGAALLLMLLVLFYYFGPFRRRVHGDFGYFSRNLPFSEPDVGGPDGTENLLSTLFAKSHPATGDSLCKWIAGKLNAQDKNLFPLLATRITTSPIKCSLAFESKFTWRASREKRANAFVELLNDILHHKILVDEEAVLGSMMVNQDRVSQARPWREPFPWWKCWKRHRQRCLTRGFLDDFLHRLALNTGNLSLVVAEDARLSARKLVHVGQHYLRFFVLLGLIILGVATAMSLTMYQDTFILETGEPLSFTSGISAWPNVVLRVVSTMLAIAFIYVLIQQLRSMFYNLARHYRIPFTEIAVPPTPQHVCVSQLWREFHKGGHFGWRLCRAGAPCLIYYGFGFIILVLLGFPFQPLRGDAVAWWTGIFRHPFVLSFLLLSFLTIDAALRCRRFINELSAAPTDYPQTTRAHFKNLRGDVGDDFLDEWIDTNLIADLTERVGGLLWFPSVVFLLMLASRNQWTDHWPTSNGLLIILMLNFVIAIASVVILQRAARRAKSQAEESLYAKVKRARAANAPTPEANNADQAEKLLDEIRNLRRGAFVGFWENPVVGALFLAPGGTAVLALLEYFAAN